MALTVAYLGILDLPLKPLLQRLDDGDIAGHLAKGRRGLPRLVLRGGLDLVAWGLQNRASLLQAGNRRTDKSVCWLPLKTGPDGRMNLL